MRNETTKVCKCGNTYLVLLPSLNKKYCTECQTYIPWYLADGQKSPTTSQVGGKIEPIISTTSKTNEIEVENSSTGKPMSDHKVFHIQLTRVTQEQLTKFLKLFGELNDVALPSHVENTIVDLLLSKEEELCLEVSHTPVALTICDTGDVQQFAPINEVIKVFEAAVAVKKVFEKIQGSSVEPESSTTTFNSAPKATPNEQPAVRAAGKKAQTNFLTVEEAAYEFQEIWQIIATALTSLDFVIPGKSRIEHVQLAMDLLVRYEFGGTTH